MILFPEYLFERLLLQITAPAAVFSSCPMNDSLAIKDISPSAADERELIPDISLFGSPASSAPNISASSDNLKLLIGDTRG